MLLTALPLAPLVAAVPLAPLHDGPATFDAPLLLTAAGEPMGHERLYPSPVLHDVDGDGQREMIIGDLFGHVHVCEKLPGDDPAAWGELKPLQGDGKPLKFSNW